MPAQRIQRKTPKFHEAHRGPEQRDGSGQVSDVSTPTFCVTVHTVLVVLVFQQIRQKLLTSLLNQFLFVLFRLGRHDLLRVGQVESRDEDRRQQIATDRQSVSGCSSSSRSAWMAPVASPVPIFVAPDSRLHSIVACLSIVHVHLCFEQNFCGREYIFG